MLMLITLTFISFTRIFFRSSNMQTVDVLFERMNAHLGLNLFWNVLQGYHKVFLLIVLGYLIHWIPESLKTRYRTWFANGSLVAMGVIAILLVFIVYQLMSGEMQPFIYFQF